MGASGGTILNIGACEETTKERKIYLLHVHKHNHCDSVTLMSMVMTGKPHVIVKLSPVTAGTIQSTLKPFTHCM